MAGRNILVVGNGAREHALIWKLQSSPLVGRISCAPGNGGTALIAENVPIAGNRIEDLAAWAESHRIDLAIIGPEEPLALGLVDRLAERGILAFGPTAAAARIEASKAWAKELMQRAGVPTAAYATFCDAADAWSYAQRQRYPLVLKADGLAAGKGVIIAQTPDEAHRTITAVLEGRVFGDAGRRLIIEEFLVGPEVSLLAFVAGRRVATLTPARDHKRIGENETGPNTGGMGAFAPTRLLDTAMTDHLRATILEPIAAELADQGIPYHGVLYAGLILTADGPRVLEFNCRFGDPETQVILPLLDDDLADIAFSVASGEFSRPAVTMGSGHCCGVVLASGGYPGAYATGRPIQGLEALDPGVLAFHAGTAIHDDTLVTAGGRVLTIVAHGATLAEARQRAYANVARIRFEDLYYRRDVGEGEAG